jgi:hypothetical protein
MPISVESQSTVAPFIRDLLKQAKLDTLPEEYLEEYTVRLESQLMERLGLVALQALPDSDLSHAEKLSEKRDFEGLMQLFQKSIPDFSDLLGKTLNEFRDQFLKSVSTSREEGKGK